MLFPSCNGVRIMKVTDRLAFLSKWLVFCVQFIKFNLIRSDWEFFEVLLLGGGEMKVHMAFKSMPKMLCSFYIKLMQIEIESAMAS